MYVCVYVQCTTYVMYGSCNGCRFQIRGLKRSLVRKQRTYCNCLLK